MQNQEGNGGARGGKRVSGVDGGGTAALRSGNDGTDAGCKAQAVGAGAIMFGSPTRMHDGP